MIIMGPAEMMWTTATTLGRSGRFHNGHHLSRHLRRRRGTRKVLVWTLALAMLIAGFGALRDWRNAAATQDHWASELRRPALDDELLLVAFGDSAMQGVGATSAETTLAGRVSRKMAFLSGRRVIVHNHAGGGATISRILAEQIPPATDAGAATGGDLARADVVIVASSNDLEQRTGPENYASDLRRLLAVLDPERTIVSDLPLEPGRRAYQEVLERATHDAGLPRADFAGSFLSARRSDIFSWLPPHLNDRGYAIWAAAFTTELPSRGHRP